VDGTVSRARGALAGLAVGDALGMPTQMLPRRTVRRLFPALDWFEPGPPENPISAGRPAGEVTDDTQQALMLAELLVEGEGHVDPYRFVARLVAWARQAELDGTEQLGPSSRRALELVERGAPISEAGSKGATNGAAMRIAPVGIATPAGDLTALLDRVEEACLATHHTGVAMAGAAAVAAAVSAAIDGAAFAEMLALAREAAGLAALRGHHFNGSDVGARIGWAVELVRGLDDEEAMDAAYDLIGTGVATQETVATAFALASRWPDDVWTACRQAAQLGGDADTIGAITGALVGARVGLEGFPAEALALVQRVNDLSFAAVAAPLLDLRAR